MSQPTWKYLANLGDATPLEYGGLFVYQDETGVYAPECELLMEPEDGDEENSKWTVYRFSLNPCTYGKGVLSDNPFHPDKAAWFAKPESERATRPQDSTYLKDVADFIGLETEELILLFVSTDPCERAHAWRAIGEYHGWENLDSYPLTFTRDEIRARYDQGELR